jgi:hypothetical protein
LPGCYTTDGTQSSYSGSTIAIKRRNTSCRTEMEPVRRVKGRNRVREAEEDREAGEGKTRKAPLAEKDQRAAAVRDLAAAGVAARGPLKTMLRINNTNVNS